MAHTYAGILGPLALSMCIVRGLVTGSGTDSLLWTAWGHLVVFAGLGAVIGWVAERITTDAVHGRIAEELASQQAATTSAPAKPAAGGQP